MSPVRPIGITQPVVRKNCVGHKFTASAFERKGIISRHPSNSSQIRSFPTTDRGAPDTDTRRESLPVWSKISNTLKRLGFQSHNFLAQLLSETSRACTIRVRRSTLGRLWNELGSHAGLHHRHHRSRTAVAERISGCGEPYPESPDQGPTAPFGS